MSRRRQARVRKLALGSAGVLALSLGFMALLGGRPASAQTAVTLVGNTGQGSVQDTSNTVAGEYAQGFITGVDSGPSGTERGGYVIHAIEFPYRDPEGDAFDVSLWRADSSGRPTARVTANFARPSSFTNNTTVVFTAPPGTVLDPGNIYAVLARSAGRPVRMSRTLSDGDDAGGALGWKLGSRGARGSGSWSRSLAGGSWFGPDNTLRITIKGQTVDSLVSNLGETPESTSDFSDGASQVFRSGGDYNLTSIEVDSADTAGDDFDVSLWTVSGGLPLQKRFELVRPDSFAAGTLIFRAPPGARISGPFGDFAVVVEVDGAEPVTLQTTASDGEDVGMVSGFSIADTHGTRSGGTWSQSSGGASIKIRVNGYSGDAPGTPGDAAAGVVGRGRVLVRWTAPNAGSSAITGYAVEVSRNAGATWSRLGSTAATATSYTDTRGGPYDDVRYRVSAFSSLGMGSPTGAVSVDPGGIALVSNLGQASTDFNPLGTVSQVFRTQGRHTVTGIELESRGTSVFGASIWTVTRNSANQLVPNQHFMDLEPPDTFEAGTLTFTVPRDRRFTTGNSGLYAVVIDTRGQTIALNTTTSDDEDGGGESGWSIGNEYGFRLGGAWTLTSGSPSQALKLRVEGYRGHVPGAPTGLSARATGPSRIALAWTAPTAAGSTEISGYRIEVSTDGSAWTELVADTRSTDTTYAHTGLEAGSTRHYRVWALNDSGAGPPSNTAEDTADVLASNVGDRLSAGTTELSGGRTYAHAFTAGDNAAGYGLTSVDIASSDAEGDSFSVAIWAADEDGTPTGSSAVYTLTAPSSFPAGWLTFTAPENAMLTAGADYVLVLTTGSAQVSLTAARTGDATDPGAASGWSIASRTHSASTTTPVTWTISADRLPMAFRGEVIPGTPPGAPTGLTATATGQTQIDLSWTAPSESGTTAISGYRIEVSTDGDAWTDLVANTGNTSTTYSHTGLAANSTRIYRVSAISSIGAGEPSGVATETTNVLVANVMQSAPLSVVVSTLGYFQGFTTGSHPGGYTLAAIEILSGDPEGDDFTADLYSTDSQGRPTGSALAGLDPPTGAGAFSAGRVRFTAPAGERLRLAADTTYAVVVFRSGSGDVALFAPSSDDEDEGKASGFSIADRYGHNGFGSWDFTSQVLSLSIAVRGQANAAPVFSQAAATRTLLANTPAGLNVGAAVEATDADGDALTYTLGGTDAASFEIVETTGQIRTLAGVTYDHEEQSSYSVTVTASDGFATATATVTIDIVEGRDTSVNAVSASVEGDELVIVFDQALAATGRLSGHTFTVRKVDSVGDTVRVRLVGRPAVSGLTVRLRLASAVGVADENVTVSYERYAVGSLSRVAGVSGVEAGSFYFLRVVKTGASVGLTAEPSGTVISINRQVNGSSTISGDLRKAQAFTTPSEPPAWTVSRYGVLVANAASSPLVVSLHADDNGQPGRELHSGTVVPSTNSLQLAAVSPDTILEPLERGSTYWIQARAASDDSFLLALNLRGPHTIAEGWSVSGGHKESRLPGRPFTDGPRLRMSIEVDAYADFGPSSDTRGVVRVGTESTGTLTRGVDGFSSGDGWHLQLRRGRRYRLELDFGDATADRGGSVRLVRPGPGGSLKAVVGDWNRAWIADDGRAVIDFGFHESGAWREDRTNLRGGSLFAWVDRSSGHFDPSDPDTIQIGLGGEVGTAYANDWLFPRLPHYGDYTLTLTDITGTVKMTGNTSKFYLGGDGQGNDWSILSWEVGKLDSTRNLSRAQRFTTGTRTGGWSLDRIEAYVHSLESGSMPQIAIHEDDNDKPKATAHCTLVSPLAYRKHPEELFAFYAPATGCDLASATEYWAVFNETSSTTGANYKIDVVDTTDADRLYPQAPTAEAWSWEGNAFQQDVNASSPAWTDTTGSTRALQFKVIARRRGSSGSRSPGNSEATGAPGISGTARVGEELTATTAAIADEDGLEDATFRYEWLADGEAIGSSGRTYTVGDGYAGAVISVRVTFTDDAGNEETLTSEPTAEVAGAVLALESAAVDGATLTLTFSEVLNSLVDLPETAFTVTVGQTARTVVDSSVLGSAVTLTLASPVAAGETVTVGYEKPEGNSVIGSTRGAAAASFTGREVTNETAEPGLTATAGEVPDSHDGSAAFSFELRFSEAPALSYVTLRDHAFTVTGGRVLNASRLTRGSNLGWRVTAEPSGEGSVTLTLLATVDCEAEGAVCSSDGKKLSAALSVEVPGPGARQQARPNRPNRPATVPTLLTAEAREAPESHDGSTAFSFEIHFSEQFDLSYATLRNHAFEVTGGSILNARRLGPPSNVGWEITVAPSGDGTVTVVLPVTTDCNTAGAICTGDNRMLSARLEISVAGPDE